jgi:DNA-binding CsgD family transcriptional regulator
MTEFKERWSQEETESLLRMRQVLSIPKCAARLGRSEKSVNKRLKRLRDREAGKLRSDPALSWSDEQKRELAQMREVNSAYKIARILKRSQKSVEAMLLVVCGKLSDDERRVRASNHWCGGQERRKRSVSGEQTCVKVRARKAVHSAIHRGVIKKLPCQVCGVKKAEAHHPDHNHYYSVVWLCPKHHKQADKALLNAEAPPPVSGSFPTQ